MRWVLFRAVAGAGFVDVGVSAGALGGPAEAEPASHPGFQQWGALPVGAASDVGQTQVDPAGLPGCGPAAASSRARSYLARTVLSKRHP